MGHVSERLERIELRRRGRSLVKLKPGQRPDPSQPPGTDLLPQIKHIVVVMMENHSYDNYLGMLTHRGEGFPLAEDGLPAVANADADGNQVRAYHMTSTTQAENAPSQSWQATSLQCNDGRMDGFVTSTQAVAPDAEAVTAGMGYWTGDDLPFYYGLARTFPLADRWFSSCPGPTFPNRRFLIAGTANGLIDDLPFHLLDYPPAGTIFDLLTRHGIAWANYHPAEDDKSTAYLARHGRKMARRRLTSLAQGLESVRAGVQKDIQFTADLFPLGYARCRLHVHSIDQFCIDADEGTLPAFSIVDPSFEDWSEENPQDIRKGESFAAEIINRVMHGRGWPETLLIWTYDEHGGYYDHVPPPPAVPPDDVDGQSMTTRSGWLEIAHRLLFPSYAKDAETADDCPMRYDSYGVRVPAVLVSPYARPDFVLSDIFDHTSILKLVEEKWNLPALTRRDAAALSPIGALDFSAPPAFLTPPELPEPAMKYGTW
jgi:phospholipase C